MLAVAVGLAALAEPSVLEKGYKPPAKQAGGEIVSLFGELSSDNAAEQPAAETAAGNVISVLSLTRAFSSTSST